MPATYVVSPPSQIFLESPHVPHRTCDECMEELEMIRAALRTRPSGRRLIQGEGSSFAPRQQTLPRGSSSKHDETLIQSISLDEDDEHGCPICSRNLSKMTDNDKEAHIADCLQKAEFSAEQRRNNRMLIYKLKEKPGGTNMGECVICFEEFMPGDTIGRLECLCVYHERCILDWFKRKGVGCCPVHAVHG
jgi:hypothetical protein